MTWLAPRALWERGCVTFIPVIACTRLSVSVNEQKKLASTSPSLLSPHAIFRAFFRSVVPTIMKPGTGCAIPVHSVPFLYILANTVLEKGRIIE